jgi:hypothetical protein
MNGGVGVYSGEGLISKKNPGLWRPGCKWVD